MTRIVATHYRYKPPPKKRKAIALGVPAIVTAKRSRPPLRAKQAAAQVVSLPQSEAVQPKHIAAATDDQKPVIVTARRPGRRLAVVSDMAPEEHKRRGDAADALFRELVRRATSKEPP